MVVFDSFLPASGIICSILLLNIASFKAHISISEPANLNSRYQSNSQRHMMFYRDGMALVDHRIFIYDESKGT